MRNLKLIKQMFYASKTFCRKCERDRFLKWFFIFKQLEKCQNEYYPESLLIHEPNVPTCQRDLRASVVYVPTCLRTSAVPTCLCANVPKACQLLMCTCQRAIRGANVSTWRANFSTWLANEPKGVPNFQACLLTKCQIEISILYYYKKILQYTWYYRYTYHMYIMYRS